MGFLVQGCLGGVLALYWGFADYPWASLPVAAGVFTASKLIWPDSRGDRSVPGSLLIFVVSLAALVPPFLIGMGVGRLLK